MPFALRHVSGSGWVRELVGRDPIVTADPVEAQRWPTRAEAQRVAVELNRRAGLVRVRVVAVEGEQEMRVEA